ncbi:MAG: hypothetical protein IJJ45_05460 [Clostridia bacterium]|nr:hypothetical protein [Clostridia bacterium]
MKKHKKLIALLIVLIVIAIAVVFIHHFRRVGLERKLLKAVDISSSVPYQSLKSTHWTDPLMYISGYDILVAHVDAGQWRMPDTWLFETKALEAIEFEQDIALVDDWFVNEGIVLPEVFDAWFFYEIGRGGDEYRDWRFYLGLHSPDGTLIIYHGHDLWSLDDEDRYDIARKARMKEIP